MTRLDLKKAREVVNVAIRKAEDMGVAMSVAICDSGGHVVVLERMDGCMILAGETVQAKARTAVYFKRPTADTVERSRKNPTVYNSFVEVAQAPIVMSMGGIPLIDEDDRIVGAVAAAGGTGEEDVQVAQAGVSRWSELLAE